VSRGLVFDSGVGGLSVTAAIRARLPELALDYVADDAFRPYGNKTASQLEARLPELLWTLREMLSSDFIVLACNTASTGVVPAIKPAALATETRRIGVLGTPGTVAHDYVDGLIDDYAQGVDVRLKGSVALVAEAEAKLAGQAVNMEVITRELSAFIDLAPKVDQIVLACTHFPLLEAELMEIMGPDVMWVDSGDAIARRVQSVMTEEGLPMSQLDRSQIAFTTGRDIGPQRQSIFQSYGFKRLVSLSA